MFFFSNIILVNFWFELKNMIKDDDVKVLERYDNKIVEVMMEKGFENDKL